MDSTIKIGRIWGIPIGLHASWFLIFGLLTWSLASGYFPQAYPQLGTVSHWLLGAITSLLFAGSVLAHELGHALLALRNNVPVRAISLFIFGGVAQVEQEPRSPGAEFRIAIAGPLVSLALVGVFGLLWLLDRSIPFLAAPSEYLMRINLILALFNMLPGFPLDGGRVLRAIVWKLTDNFKRATKFASGMGQLVAFGFIGFGIYTALTGNFFNGLWLAFIGWFLQNAAASAYLQISVQKSLEGIPVRQVMSTELVKIPRLTPLSQVVEERVLNGGHRSFFVADNGRLDGMLTLQEIGRIPQAKWGFTTSQQVMIPVDRLVKVAPETDLLEALKMMDDTQIAQVPVLQEGELVGTLSREQVLHYLRTRAEIGI